MFFFGAVANARLKIALPPVGGGINPLATPLWSSITNFESEVVAQANNPNVNYYFRLGGFMVPSTGGGALAYTTEGDWRSEASANGSIAGLGLFIITNNRSEASTFSLMVNGVASTTQFITIPAGATGWRSTLGLPQAVNKGDVLSLRMNFVSQDFGSIRFSEVESGFTGAAGIGSVAHHNLTGYYNYPHEGAASTTVMGAPIHGIGQGNSFAPAWAGTSVGVPAFWACVVTTPGATGRMRLHIPTNTCTVAATFTLFKNGAATAMTLTVPASTTGVFTAEQAVALVAGDKLEWRRWGASSGTGNYAVGNLSLSITTNSAYDVFGSMPPQALLQEYNAADFWLGACMFSPRTADNAKFTKHRMPQAGVISTVSMRAVNSTPGTATWDQTLMKNGVATSAVMTVPAVIGTQSASSASPVTFAAGDRLNFKFRCNAFAQSPVTFTMTVTPPA